MFTLQETPIDLVAARNSFNVPSTGALVSFEGIVRRDEHPEGHVGSLVYMADNAACLAEGNKIVTEALNTFPLANAVCIQRIGKLDVGETAIWIGVWAGHRDEAFKGCRYIIEEVKKRLIIWKKEYMEDGTGKWVHGKETSSL